MPENKTCPVCWYLHHGRGKDDDYCLNVRVPCRETIRTHKTAPFSNTCFLSVEEGESL